MRPCPAQSNSSRPPSVKKLRRRLPRSDTQGLPFPRSCASKAAAAGMGEDAPTAAWRALPIKEATTSASISSARAGSGGALGIDMAIKINRKALRRPRHPGIFHEMRGVGGIAIGERQRPGSLRGKRNRVDIEAAERAGGEAGIVEQAGVVN